MITAQLLTGAHPKESVNRGRTAAVRRRRAPANVPSLFQQSEAWPHVHSPNSGDCSRTRSCSAGTDVWPVTGRNLRRGDTGTTILRLTGGASEDLASTERGDTRPPTSTPMTNADTTRSRPHLLLLGRFLGGEEVQPVRPRCCETGTSP